MPELPEVTTFIDNLNQHVLNKKIINVVIIRDKVIKNATDEEFKKFFIGEEFTIIKRDGKYLIFFLTHDKQMVMHLRMEGKIIYDHHDDPLLNKSDWINWIFPNNEEMRYYDTRLFGAINIYTNNGYKNDPGLKKLGPEPFSSEFTWQYLKEKFAHHPKIYLKQLLMDQSIIAGIGNIYASEICFACKLSPYLLPNQLTDQDYKELVKQTKVILSDAIKYKGTTVSSYAYDNKNHAGNYQSKLKVYGRQGKPCYVCGTPIVKTEIDGRGTYFCPHCQHVIIPKDGSSKHSSSTKDKDND